MSPARRLLPPLTHLQFLILGALLADQRSGKALRRELGRYGVRRTAAAFYQMMARIEDANWVSGAYTQQIVDGQIIKERSYRITAAGERAWTRTRDFYAEAGRAGRVAHA